MDWDWGKGRRRSDEWWLSMHSGMKNVTYIFEKPDMRKKLKDGSDERRRTQNMARNAAGNWSGRGERMAGSLWLKKKALSA